MIFRISPERFVKVRPLQSVIVDQMLSVILSRLTCVQGMCDHRRLKELIVNFYIRRFILISIG